MLREQNRLYEACSPRPAPCVHLRFTGPFEQKIIIWDAQIATLAYYLSEHKNLNMDCKTLRPFINVGNHSEPGRYLQIGLNVTTIDDATIIKSMIMIRQYKRLQVGRYEYGDPYCSNEVS